MMETSVEFFLYVGDFIALHGETTSNSDIVKIENVNPFHSDDDRESRFADFKYCIQCRS